MTGKRKPKGSKTPDEAPKTPDPDTSYQGPDREVVSGEVALDPEPIPETKPEPEPKPEKWDGRSLPVPPYPAQKPPKPRVELRIYLATSGHKADQIAGFRHWASKQDLVRRTIQEWRVLHQNFNARPTK